MIAISKVRVVNPTEYTFSLLNKKDKIIHINLGVNFEQNA